MYWAGQFYLIEKIKGGQFDFAIIPADIYEQVKDVEATIKTRVSLWRRIASGAFLLTLFRGSWVKGLKALPTLDGTRKVHGVLLKIRELHKYSVDELKIFLEELKISVAERKRLNGILGADHGHGLRVGEEHALIRTIERILENISL